MAMRIMSKISRPLTGALLIGLVWGPPPLAAAMDAQRAADARTIAGLEETYSQSFVTGDDRVAKRLISDDFIGFESNGKTSDKAAVLADVKDEPRPKSLTIPSLTVRLHGDTAVALGTEEDVMPDGKQIHRRWLDTWRRTGEGWQLVSSGETIPQP